MNDNMPKLIVNNLIKVTRNQMYQMHFVERKCNVVEN